MAKENNFLKKINENLDATLGGGIIIGAIGILGYGLALGNKLGWHFVFLFFLLAAACYIAGFFLGILFGIPKRQNNDNQAEYLLNNNLADISDWLTKIIIGLGLIELKNIPTYLSSAGDYVMNSVDGKESSLKLFAICCIVYFAVFGLYYGYCYMRLYLSGQIKKADDDLLEKKRKEAKEVDVVPNEEIILDKEDKKKFSDFNEQLKSSKKEEDYTSEDWYLKGIDNYNNKEYEKTIACMKNSLSTKATNTEQEANAYLYIGLSQANLGLVEKSIEQYDKIITEYPTYNKLYLIYYNKGVALSGLKRYKEALDSVNKATELKPDHGKAWNNKSTALINLKRYDEALIAVNKALELQPDSTIVWSNKSLILSNLKRFAEALEAANKAIELKSDYETAWANKSLVLGKLKRFDEALEAANKAIELKPNYALAWNNKSSTLINLKRFNEALEAANKAIEFKPDMEIAWTNKSLALNRLNQFDEALSATNKALELKPDYEVAWSQKSLVLNNLKRYNEALESANEAIKLKPDYLYSWNNKCVALFNLKQYEDALNAANNAIKLNPTISHLFYNRAKVYAGLNKKDNMILDLKQAIELDSNWKENAKTDDALKNYWEDADFKKLVD